MADSWIICETTGRWAAALRANIARIASDRANTKALPRIHEVRHFADFQTSIAEGQFTLGLLEVQRDHLAVALNFLSADHGPHIPIVALLHESLLQDAGGEHKPSSPSHFAADSLREAGAIATVSSPRRISSLLGLTQSLAAAHSRPFKGAVTQPTFAEFAKAALPWQDE